MAPRGLEDTEWEWKRMELVVELVHNLQDTLDMMLYPLPLMSVHKTKCTVGPFITRFNLHIAKSLDYRHLSLQMVFLPICHSAKRPSIPCMCTLLLSESSIISSLRATELYNIIIIIILQYLLSGPV